MTDHHGRPRCSVWLTLLAMLPQSMVFAKPPMETLDVEAEGERMLGSIPTLKEVVEAEGWTVTPTQSGIYSPGVVLVPNGRGTHDVVATDCIAVEPVIAIMSQSSIALSLRGGVEGNLGVGSAAARAGVTKELTFVDPEQRTIPLGRLQPSEECKAQIEAASAIQDLSGAILVHDVLVAIVKNTVCKKVEASGKFATIAGSEAAAISECMQESAGQVPVGFKAVPLSRLVRWGEAGEARAEVDLATCLRSKVGLVQNQAKADWKLLAPLTSQTEDAAKAAGAPYVKKFLGMYEAPTVFCEHGVSTRSVVVEVPEVALARVWQGIPAPNAGGAPRADLGNSGTRTSEDSRPDLGHALPTGTPIGAGNGGLLMRPVPAGTYLIGCTPAHQGDCFGDEMPTQTVTLSRAIWVGQTEVTQEQVQALMGNNPSKFYDCGPDCPVERVSWVDAIQFANQLSQVEGLETCYLIEEDGVTWPKGTACLGYRLPTEAEWEVAARGGQDSRYSGGTEIHRLGWYSENSGSSTHPVGTLQANAFGLFDMTGNVAEWVWDRYHGGAYAVGPATDPQGPTRGATTVIRGGGWRDLSPRLRIAVRQDQAPGSRNNDLGFRVVRTQP